MFFPPQTEKQCFVSDLVYSANMECDGASCSDVRLDIGATFSIKCSANTWLDDVTPKANAGGPLLVTCENVRREKTRFKLFLCFEIVVLDDVSLLLLLSIEKKLGPNHINFELFFGAYI